MKNILIYGLISLAAMQAFAAELKDPYLRDDDVSMTGVDVNVSVNAAGHYTYLYSVNSSAENTGYILSFTVDIGCSEAPDSLGFDSSDYPSGAMTTPFDDGKHVPVAIHAPRGQAALWGVTAKNDADWAVALLPGEARQGLQIVSPYPPGPREYKLVPSENYKWDEYDYDNVAWDTEATETLPWIDDWTVTGITTGPACPGEEYPDNGGGDDDTRFPGALFAGETDALNQLLTYSKPLQDQFHQTDGTRELEMTIHYHADIDPKTFVVTPQRHGINKLFHPAPGISETVRLPLDAGKNRIELQVKSRFTPPGKAGQPPADSASRGGVNLDKDVFVVRTPIDATAPGQGKGSNK